MEILRSKVVAEFTKDLPDGVHPVGEWCADPQFFPGATGLLLDRLWSDVRPGSAGMLSALPPAPQGGVIVIGNYQATLASYARITSGAIGGFPTTWRVLPRLLASVAPTDVFLTNAFIGLPDLARDTAPFPTTPTFRKRCEGLLRMEIELFRPRTVVCLGSSAAKMLASVTPALSTWRPWRGYESLRAGGKVSVRDCAVADAEFVAVAVRHPAAVISSEERDRDAAFVAAAAVVG